MQDSPNRAAIKKKKKKKEKGGRKTLVLCFSNSCHFDCLLAVSLDNLPATETNPIGRSAPVRSKRERREHTENSKGNSGMGGEREHREKNVPVKPRCLRRRGSLMWHIQNSADKQGSGPRLLLIKGAVVLNQTAPSFSSRQSRAPRGLGCKEHVRNSAAQFLRIFPLVPCFFLMASGVHWKGRRKEKKLSFQDRQFSSKVGHEITTFMALWVKFPNGAARIRRVNWGTPSPLPPSPYQHLWRIQQKRPADSERE